MTGIAHSLLICSGNLAGLNVRKMRILGPKQEVPPTPFQLAELLSLFAELVNLKMMHAGHSDTFAMYVSPKFYAKFFP